MMAKGQTKERLHEVCAEVLPLGRTAKLIQRLGFDLAYALT
jgi:hypothetical protein